MQYIQLNLFDYLAKPIKTEREEDILYAVNHGSGFEKGKIRIFNFYNAKNPTMQQFADFLSEEYGTGGCGCGCEYGSSCDSKGFSFRRYGRKYDFNWLSFAKEIAKVIENKEYDISKELQCVEHYKEKDFDYWTTKHFYLTTTYENKEVVCARFTTSFEEPKGYIHYDTTGILRYSCIFIDEIVRAIESGAYNTPEEIWQDIEKSGRYINGATFGGRKHEDERGIREYLDNYKRTGFAQGSKSYWADEKCRDWEFWQSRALQKGIIDYDGRKII